MKHVGFGEMEEESAQEGEQIVPKRGKTTSPVWNHFGFYQSDVPQDNCICRHCKMVVATTKGNTTNLISHIKNHHKDIHQTMNKSVVKNPSLSKDLKKDVMEIKPSQVSQQTITSSLLSVTPYEKTSKRHKDITQAITNFVAKDMLPVYTVEKDGFQKMLSVLDKRYHLPSSTYFHRVAIPNLYDNTRKAVEKELGKEVKYFSGTTDLWSSRTTEPYISLTIHYINNDFQLKS